MSAQTSQAQPPPANVRALRPAAGPPRPQPAASAAAAAAEPQPATQGWLSEAQKEFFHTHKGTISLSLSALLFLVSYWIPEGPDYWVRAAGEAALVGSLVDYMAIKMLFERYPMLPGSGVIPRNREKIIEGLANAVEREWLTPEMLKQHFAGLDLAGLVRSGLTHIQNDDEILKTLLHEVSTNGVSWVDNHQFLDFLAKKIREKVGRLGHFAHNVGVIDFDEMAVDVAENIASEIKRLPENEQIKRLIQDELAKVGTETGESITVNVRIERIKEAIIDSLFSQLEGRIAEMVRGNLEKFSDKQIKDMFETKTRKHLEWIRVNGAVYGALFGLILAALGRYAGLGGH